MLFWLTSDELRGTCSLAIAFFSVYLLQYLEESAYVRTARWRSEKVLAELYDHIQSTENITSRNIDNYNKKAASATTDAEREAYKELAWLASTLADRDQRMVKNEVATKEQQKQQEQRQAKELEDEKKAIEEEAKTLAEKQSRAIKFLETFNRVLPLPIIKTMDDLLQDQEALLEMSVLKQKWQPLKDFAKKTLEQTHSDCDLKFLLHSVCGIKVKDDVSIVLEFQGNERDGYCEAFAVKDEERLPLSEGLIFESSLDGVIAALFIQVALPRYWAWGHGLYDRDHVLVMTFESAVEILEASHTQLDKQGLHNLTSVPGIRLSRTNSAIKVACLIYLPGKGFSDIAVTIDDGRLLSTDECILYHWGRGVLY